MMKLPTYVIVTPARNEARFIALVLESVIAQTALPLRWVVVSDGSTDETDALVLRYAQSHPWIELLHLDSGVQRNFAGKVNALHAGYERVQGLAFDAVAFLDADLEFAPQYFAFLLEKLAGSAALGLVGTAYVELDNESYDYNFVSREHVAGACQLFRRACYEQIGGYRAIAGGAIDSIIGIEARMYGWQTRTFTEMYSRHHRKMGTAGSGPLRSRFKTGMKDYAIGNHPLWELVRGLYQMTRPPFLLRGVAVWAGYVWATLRCKPRAVPAEVMRFYRREQMLRLSAFVKRCIHGVRREEKAC